MSKEKIAFVVARYGINVNGGAEYHCRMLAERLIASYAVEVLATCVDNYRTGGNTDVKTSEEINGVCVRRFKADPIHPEQEAFYKHQARWSYKLRRLLYKWRLLAPIASCFPVWRYKEKEELQVLNSQVFYSSSLFEFIKRNQADYKVIIPITLDYPHVYYTALIAPSKTLVIPTMHYHKIAFRSILTSVFTQAAYIGFNTEAEQRLAEGIFGKRMSPHGIISVGIELSAPADWESTREKYRLPEEYLLYVGRVDSGKLNNICDYFQHYKETHPDSSLKFVLVGGAFTPPVAHPDMVYTGFVDEPEKRAIIEHAKIVVNPSQYESLSLILLEALTLKKAMLVNGKCNVLKEHCRKSKRAVLYYTSRKSFIETLRLLDSSDKLREEMGEKGAAYVAQNYHWERIMNRLIGVIESMPSV